MKAAAIRQDRSIPVHEPVKPAHRAYHIIARAQMKMVSIRKLDLAAKLLQVDRAYAALDRRLRADVHENGRLHLPAMRAPELAPARLSFISDNLEHSASS